MRTVEEQLSLLLRGVDQVEPANDLKKKLEASVASGKPLRVKYGIDPTGIDVHLGHTVPLRKLRTFQELGHQAVLIIGTATALVGDPSGRDQTRARLTAEAVEANARDYLKQVSKVIDITRTEVRPNGDWFGKFGFGDLLALCSKITVQRMLERDDFSKRFKSEPSQPIYLHECLYPLMQGHDSVEIHADIELGGSEQLFNLMMGRRLQEADGQPPQICMTLPILRGLDGVRRMGKSLGNYVGVGESAGEQFGKIMSVPDELMQEWFELLTDVPAAEIHKLTDATITHPMTAKKALGREIVGYYHGLEAATAAQAEWEKQFSARQDPTDIPEIALSADAGDPVAILKVLTACGLIKSNGEGKRKIQEGAVTIGPDRTRVEDAGLMVTIGEGLIVRLGRHVRRVRRG